MVQITSLFTAAALFSVALAAPVPDSTVNEPAVEAPNGTIITIGATPTPDNSGSNYSGSSYSGSGSSGSDYSGSNYSGSDSSYDSYDSSSSVAYDTQAYATQAYTSTTEAYNTQAYATQAYTYTTQAYTSSTSQYYAAQSTSTTSYGSGSSSWGGSGYDSCVNQCMASYGAPAATYAPSPTYTMGSSGSGATHTVTVAPTQGVLRFVPFMINASVGDTVMFMWGANNHTVTKSSELLPCNKSTENPVFASGTQNEGFVFTQVINNTDTTFYYCGTPGHCEKGMFGIINPPTVPVGSNNSMASNMQSLVSSDADLAAMAAYTNNVTGTNDAASSWGDNLDVSQLPTWSMPLVAQNMLFSRAFLAMNPEVINADGTINLGNSGTTPLMIPTDISNALADNSTSTSSSSSAAASATGSSSASAAPSASSAAKSNGAISAMASPRSVVALVSVVATFFLL